MLQLVVGGHVHRRLVADRVLGLPERGGGLVLGVEVDTATFRVSISAPSVKIRGTNPLP